MRATSTEVAYVHYIMFVVLITWARFGLSITYAHQHLLQNDCIIIARHWRVGIKHMAVAKHRRLASQSVDTAQYLLNPILIQALAVEHWSMWFPRRPLAENHWWL